MKVKKTPHEQKLKEHYITYIEGDERIPHSVINEFKRDVEKIRKAKLEKLVVKLKKRKNEQSN